MKLSGFCPILFLLVTSHPAHAQSAECTTMLTPLELQLGQGLPLPRTFSNPTGNRVKFTVTMLANQFFGSTRELTSLTLDAHRGTTSSSPSAHPTGLRTPAGTGTVSIVVTTDRTDGIVGRCDYRLTLKPPPGVPGKVPRSPLATMTPGGLNWLYQVPVRMCVLQGSVLAGSRVPGDTVSGKEMIDLLESVNKEIWFPQAQIAFSSSIDRGFPVIADPSSSSGSCGTTGELSVSGPGQGDGPFAEQNCATAWEQKYPGRAGIPVIFARNLCGSGPAQAAAPSAPIGLHTQSQSPLTGRRGDDYCGVPKRLTRNDIYGLYQRPFVVLIEPANATRARNNLAHELGHDLFLGHGNGLDDNRDGMAAGKRGPKRYDEFCDPGALAPPDFAEVAEDLNVAFTTCDASSSLMNTRGSCDNLQPLQVETVRSIAPLFDGFIDTTPQQLTQPVLEQ